MVTTPELALRVVEIVAILLPLIVIIFQLLFRYINEGVIEDTESLNSLATLFIWGAIALTGTGSLATIVLYASSSGFPASVLMISLYVTMLLIGGLVVGLGFSLRSRIPDAEEE